MEPSPEFSLAPPDLAPEHLEPRAEAVLGPGLEIEDAEIGRLGAEERATSGRIVHARIAAGELGGARLADLRLVDVVAEQVDAANETGAALRSSESSCAAVASPASA